MDFKDFGIADFLQNEFFVSWVITQDPDTDHFWSDWLSQHPEKIAEVKMARELVKSMHYKNQYRMDNDEYSQLMGRILQHDRPQTLGNKIGKFLVRNSFRIAASLILVLGAVFYNTQIKPATQNEQVTAELKIVSTDYGQKKIVRLPDGTKVIMNSGSTIKYPMPFVGEKRMVEFEGEGFFEVTHNPDKPFHIKSKSFTTYVLGTSFNLRSFPSEEHSSVSVATGKVKIKSDVGEYALLTPSEVGYFNHKTKKIDQSTFDQSKILAWTEGVLLFENESLPAIFKRLERWYGVEIVVDEGVNLTGKYSGEYKKKSLELVLEGLSYTSNFSYKIKNQTINIYAKKKTN
ncbi:MAG: FecR family protein [Marinoscillum sp.]